MRPWTVDLTEPGPEDEDELQWGHGLAAVDGDARLGVDPIA